MTLGRGKNCINFFSPTSWKRGGGRYSNNKMKIFQLKNSNFSNTKIRYKMNHSACAQTRYRHFAKTRYVTIFV